MKNVMISAWIKIKMFLQKWFQLICNYNNLCRQNQRALHHIITDKICHNLKVFLICHIFAYLSAKYCQITRGVFLLYSCIYISMTSLLTHTFAHSTRPSFRLKTNNQPLKKFLSLAVSWVKVVKNGKILTFKVNFPCQKLKKKFIEEYDFRGTLFVIDIFWKLQFFNHYIS